MERSILNSGEGWKFFQESRHDSVSDSRANSHYPNSTYYKIKNGVYGKIKVVNKYIN